jgi:hypothetical protein
MPREVDQRDLRVIVEDVANAISQLSLGHQPGGRVREHELRRREVQGSIGVPLENGSHRSGVTHTAGETPDALVVIDADDERLARGHRAPPDLVMRSSILDLAITLESVAAQEDCAQSTTSSEPGKHSVDLPSATPPTGGREGTPGARASAWFFSPWC